MHFLAFWRIFCHFNPFPKMPWFLRVCSASLLITLWEKEKLLVKSNFSFFHSIFYPFLLFSPNLKLSSASTFSLEKSKICCLGKGKLNLKVSSANSFKPIPTWQILDQTKLKAFAKNKINVTKMIISVFDRVENIVGKREIACTSNFSFSHNVLQRLLSQTCPKASLCGNGLIQFGWV